MTSMASSERRTFIDPRSLVFWVFVGLIVYGVLHLYPLMIDSLTRYPNTGLASLIIWSVYAVLLAVILYRMELFERRSPVTIVGAFLWGAVVVAGIATVSSEAVSGVVAETIGVSAARDWGTPISAPLLEEPLKMLGVVALALIPGARITSALDGLFYGLIVGLGFEFTESLLYTANGAADEGGAMQMVVLIFVLRGLIGGLWSHPTFTAITGAGVGYFFSGEGSRLRRSLVLAGSLLVAMALHGFFDTDYLGDNALVASIVKGLPAVLLVLLLLRLARNRVRSGFARVVRSELPDDLITAEEWAALQTKRARRHARRAVRRLSGFAGSHAMRRLQRSQLELVSAARDSSPSSPEVAEAAERLRADRAVVAHMSNAASEERS